MALVSLAALVVVLAVGLGLLAAQLRARDDDARRRVPVLLRGLSGWELALVAVGPANDTGRTSGVCGEMLTTPDARAQIMARAGIDASASCCFVALDIEPVIAPPGMLTSRVPWKLDAAAGRIYYTPGPDARRQVLLAVAGEVLRRSGVQWTRADAEALAEELAHMARNAPVARRHKMIR